MQSNQTKLRHRPEPACSSSVPFGKVQSQKSEDPPFALDIGAHHQGNLELAAKGRLVSFQFLTIKTKLRPFSIVMEREGERLGQVNLRTAIMTIRPGETRIKFSARVLEWLAFSRKLQQFSAGSPCQDRMAGFTVIRLDGL